MRANLCLLLFCGFCVVSSLGCRKDSFVKKFGIRLERDFSVPAGLDILDAHYFVLSEMPTFYANLIAQEDVPDGAKVSLVPEKALITSRFGNIDFDFIEKVSVKIYTNANIDDKAEAFYIEYIPKSVDGELALIPTSFEALPFLKDGLVNAEVKFLFKITTPQQLDLHIQMDFRGNY